MPSSFSARPAPAGLPPSRCPDCGAALAGAGVHDVVHCACRADVGAALLDDDGRRLAVRAVFTTTTEQPCAACGGHRRRVLVGSEVGIVCDGCGVVVRRARRGQESPTPRRSLAGVGGELALIMTLVGLVVVGLYGLTAG